MTNGAAAPYTRAMKPLGMLSAVATLAACGSVTVHRHVLPVSPVTREIQVARKTDPNVFSVFPGFAGAIRCRIPNGASLVSHPLRGACATLKVRTTPGSGETAPQMRYPTTDGVAPEHLLAGEVQIAAYRHGGVYICGIQSSDLMFDQPPDCRGDLRAVGVHVASLTSRAKGNPERWGTLYLVGTYRGGAFHVSSQRKWAPPGRGPGPFFETPPCATPAGGWRLVAPTYPQKSKIRVYEHRYRRDITSVVYFHQTTIPVISAFHPARVRARLAPFWPRQLCVVRARYPLRAVSRARRRLLALMAERSRTAEYGWINGAGGLSESDQGQPTAPVDVLVETPELRRFVRSEPPGLVVVDAALAPLR